MEDISNKITLYYAPGACSFAPHIALREVGADFNLEKVDIRAGKTETGLNYKEINPLGYVPALRLPDSTLLTEAAAILLYIADEHPYAKLVPDPKTRARYQTYRWLTFISSELHKGFGPLFNPHLPDEQRAQIIERLGTRFAFVDAHLAEHEWLAGDAYSVADIYAFVILGWGNSMQLDMNQWQNIQAFLARVGARDAVRNALAIEHK